MNLYLFEVNATKENIKALIPSSLTLLSTSGFFLALCLYLAYWRCKTKKVKLLNLCSSSQKIQRTQDINKSQEQNHIPPKNQYEHQGLSFTKSYVQKGHDWQNRGLRKRKAVKSEQSPFEQFSEDAAVGIPIGYFSIDKGTKDGALVDLHGSL